MFHDPCESPLLAVSSVAPDSRLLQLSTGSRTGQVSYACSMCHRLLTVCACIGLIRERLWYGEGGLQQLRTVKEPKQALATFEDTIELLMRVCTRLAPL